MGVAGQRFDRLERAHRLGGQGRSLLRDEHRFSGHMPVRGLWQGSGCARMKEKLEARKRFVPLRFLGAINYGGNLRLRVNSAQLNKSGNDKERKNFRG